MRRFQVVFDKGWYTWNVIDGSGKIIAESKLFDEDKSIIIDQINFSKDARFHAPIVDNTPETPPSKRKPRHPTGRGRGMLWGSER